MAGKGRAPKDPSELSPKAKRDKPFTEVEAEAIAQPHLEDVLGEKNPLTGNHWSKPTLLLWSQLADFPSTANLLPAQWSSLARAFMLDDALISGDQKMAVEARIRLSKYGIDPDDLMRMRIKVSTPNDNAKQEIKSSTNGRKLRLLKAVGADDNKENQTA
jgi:hypothetical protein